MIPILLQASGIAPDDCILTGLCGLIQPERPVAPGVMYAAVGLVLFGFFGYLRQRDRSPAIGDPRSPDDS
jgi:hypothetical protein